MDDDPIFRIETAQFLTANGYVVTTCETASEAKEQLQAEPFDIVISDIFVKSDGKFVADGGISLLGWLQTRSKVPIIAVTGVPDGPNGSFLQNMRDLGAKVCLSKPLDQRELLAKVRMLLSESAKRR